MEKKSVNRPKSWKTLDRVRNTGGHLNDDDNRVDFYDIVESNIQQATPFISLFWEEQKMLANSNQNALKYHPMIIRFCISTAAKSESAYDELRNT